MIHTSLLIVEDDAALRLTIDQLLSPYFDTIQCCGRVASALLLVDRKQYDVALIDRVLPDGSGLELVSYLSEGALQTKIIMMSYLGSSLQKSQGIERGALDYLAKPIHPAELLLKVKKYLRIYFTQDTQQITTSSCHLDLSTGLYTSQAKQVRLRKKELLILACLLHHRPHVVRREQLIDSVWGTCNRPLHSTLDVYIRRIRSKLGTDAASVKTIRSYGYAYLEPKAA